MKFGLNVQKTPEYSLHISVFMYVCFFYQLFVFQTGHRNNANFDAIAQIFHLFIITSK